MASINVRKGLKKKKGSVKEGPPPQKKNPPEFIHKKLCIHCYMFKLQSPSKYSIYIWCNKPTETFFHCSKRFLNLLILIPFNVFLFHLFHICRSFPLRTFFIQGNKKKKRVGQDGVKGESETQESCDFWSKPAEHSAQCGQVCCHLPTGRTSHLFATTWDVSSA